MGESGDMSILNVDQLSKMIPEYRRFLAKTAWKFSYKDSPLTEGLSEQHLYTFIYKFIKKELDTLYYVRRIYGR